MNLRISFLINFGTCVAPPLCPSVLYSVSGCLSVCCPNLLIALVCVDVVNLIVHILFIVNWYFSFIPE